MDYISSSSSQISKSAACDKMMISRTNLYYQLKLPAKDLLLKQQIEAVLFKYKAYGHRRIAIALGVNKKRVKRVMKLFDIKSRKLRKKPRIRKNKFLSNSARNLLADFTISKPDQAWVSDFTYLSYQSRWLYLATILDAFTREVIAQNISVRHNAELITEALMVALDKRANIPL